MTDAEREAMHARLAKTNKQSTTQSGKNGFALAWGGEVVTA
ncbi:hypothetical protein ACIGW7_40035 [Streptomyces sp. NPDC053253]